MPLIGNEQSEALQLAQYSIQASSSSLPVARPSSSGKQSQHSVIAKSAIMGHLITPPVNVVNSQKDTESKIKNEVPSSRTSTNGFLFPLKGSMQCSEHGAALTDTPFSTAPNSPRMSVC